MELLGAVELAAGAPLLVVSVVGEEPLTTTRSVVVIAPEPGEVKTGAGQKRTSTDEGMATSRFVGMAVVDGVGAGLLVDVGDDELVFLLDGATVVRMLSIRGAVGTCTIAKGPSSSLASPSRALGAARPG